MYESTITYFQRCGRENTGDTLRLAKARADRLGIKHLVVATGGATGLAAAQVFKDTDVNIIAITLHAGRWQVYSPPDWETVRQAEALGVRFHTATHALYANVERAVHDRFGGVSASELMAETLTIFSTGVKVAVEVSLMAADANLIPIDQEVIAVAGTDGGADTALVLKPAYSSTFFDLRVKEIICKPRDW